MTMGVTPNPKSPARESSERLSPTDRELLRELRPNATLAFVAILDLKDPNAFATLKVTLEKRGLSVEDDQPTAIGMVRIELNQIAAEELLGLSCVKSLMFRGHETGKPRLG